ncbi:choloylglycine hydrolase family protein [Solibacillus sp. FSL W7-1324]|uniref:choloylglycine hydrolase family protein n=1 Tax=Solibacillus sp. FSL W7-1324 TaxID=2921701 RepID=UPI0030F7533F
MCTAISVLSLQGENIFGRTMDFSHPIEPKLWVIPRNYQWNSLATMKTNHNRFSFMAIGQETDGMLGFFDGVNERGFAAATLYFEGYADYDLPLENKEPIASLDFLHYLLGRCSSVDDVAPLLKNIQIVGVADPVTQKAAPLHWIATDRSGKCIVIEQTKTGLEVIENPIGVMANSPDFRWHLTNLRNYMEISTTQKKNVNWGNVSLTPFSQGGGTAQLPGGFTSPSRFVRTAFLKTHVHLPDNPVETIMTCFHLLNSVFIPKGIVITDRGTDDYTKYVAFMNTSTCEYYFKTYENNQILTSSLWNYDLHGTQPICLGNIRYPSPT